MLSIHRNPRSYSQRIIAPALLYTPLVALFFPVISVASQPSLGHWAFQPIQSPVPPPASIGHSDHPIDRFIDSKLRERNLQPVAQSDARALCRRLYFDLIGLPPTPAELEAF